MLSLAKLKTVTSFYHNFGFSPLGQLIQHTPNTYCMTKEAVYRIVMSPQNFNLPQPSATAESDADPVCVSS